MTTPDLTHQTLGKMAAILQTIFSDAFSWMKSILSKISLKFDPMGPVNNIPVLVQIKAAGHYQNQWWLVYWCIYVSLGLNELTHWTLGDVATLPKSAILYSFQ